MFLYAACLLMTTVGLEKFHSKAIILREPLNFCREVAAVRQVLSLLLSLQFTIIFSHAKGNTPRPACLGFL